MHLVKSWRKIGPGGTSIVQDSAKTLCETFPAASQRDIEGDFDSAIVLQGIASADKGSGRLSWKDFSYRSRSASDESIHDSPNTDFEGQLGSIS